MLVKIKPLSVNEAWQGRRFKTKDYKTYEAFLLYTLKQLKIPSGPLSMSIEFGFSNKGADIDNCVKPFLDVLQKRYNFNDNKIYSLNITKKIVKKGEEYIKYNLTPYIYVPKTPEQIETEREKEVSRLKNLREMLIHEGFSIQAIEKLLEQ